MADALCGPSNPLQTFSKQTAVDRSLQQDRLAARQAQAESFRSLPGRNAGILDAEFEAFQAGRPLETPYLPPQPLSYDQPAPVLKPDSRHATSTLTDWASDFQRLNIDDARSSPVPSSQFHQYAPLQRSQPIGWHEDFISQNQSLRQPLQGQHYAMSGPSYALQNASQYTQYPPLVQQEQPCKQADEFYDEAAFEKAFENAKSDMRLHEQGMQLDQDLYRTEEAGATLDDTAKQFASSVGDMRLHEEDTEPLHYPHDTEDRRFDFRPEDFEPLDREGEEEKLKNHEDPAADELARTAGQLLENVKGDQSRKFQESSFLSLMRQLRDREVRVEGDKFVHVSMPSVA